MLSNISFHAMNTNSCKPKTHGSSNSASRTPDHFPCPRLSISPTHRTSTNPCTRRIEPRPVKSISSIHSTSTHPPTPSRARSDKMPQPRSIPRSTNTSFSLTASGPLTSLAPGEPDLDDGDALWRSTNDVLNSFTQCPVDDASIGRHGDRVGVSCTLSL